MANNNYEELFALIREKCQRENWYGPDGENLYHRADHDTLPIVGAFKLAHHLASLTIASYTDQWSALAPAGVLV